MKDIFRGYVKDNDHAIRTLAKASLAMFLGGVVLIWAVLTFHFYFTPGLRNILIGCGILDIVVAIAYPILTIFFVRRFDRYPRVSKFMLKTEF